MKKFFLLALVGLWAGLAVRLSAQTAGAYPLSLVIEQNSPQERAVYPLTSVHKITFENHAMQVQLNDGTPQAQIGLAGILKCHFSTQYKPTALAEMIDAASSLSWYVQDNKLYITGLPSQGVYPIAVYQANGLCIFRAAQFDGHAPIDIASWPAGYYLVEIHNTAIKIVKQ